MSAEAYPDAPGYRRTDTSREAAQAIDSKTLRAKVLGVLAGQELTADEVAGHMGASVLSIRPRLTELKLQGKVVDTGLRRPNASGRNAIVFAVAA